MLHGSPQASRAVAAVAEACANRGLCAISPDTPGAGRSDPLPGERPSSADYAGHLKGLADALGLRRVGLYGFHTGAATACAFAGLFPERTSAVALEGLPAWTEAERVDFTANYLPPFRPAWDGSHMTWLWARMEEQSVFFPWSSPTAEARMGYPVSPTFGVHANAMDLLDAGDAYRAVYQAAFDFRPESWLEQLRAPALICTTEFDVLREHLDRAPLVSKGRAFESLVGIQAACAEHLAAHPGEVAPPAPSIRDRGFVDVGGEALAWRGEPAGVLTLHAAGGRLDDLALEGLRLDLPGHGDSAEGWDEAPVDLAGWADVVSAALASIGASAVGISGQGIGGRIAERLGGRSIGSGYGPPPSLGFGSVSLRPEWDGAHLVRAWRIARWERLFKPWHERVQARALNPFGDLDPQAIHRRAVGLLKAHDRWLAAAHLEAP
ncbi:alpha/beta fold hydrolase [Phenylobacterium sp.]|uniref:alpha/beta hydrolase n=1 Tax=Phenylobacterium sp. TaxID=1871053 RepID=UPI0037C9E940